MSVIWIRPVAYEEQVNPFPYILFLLSICLQGCCLLFCFQESLGGGGCLSKSKANALPTRSSSDLDQPLLKPARRAHAAGLGSNFTP